MSFVEYTGHARLDRRTKHLVRRLSADDIAIIDHTDLDRVSAEELLESGVRVVVNVSDSQTGRYPNPGPLLLVRGGVRLIDAPGADLFDKVGDGELITVRGGSLFRNGTRLVAGQELRADDLADALREQRGRVTEALETFAENTMRYLREEGRLLSEGSASPPSRRGFVTGTRSSWFEGRATSATCASSVRTCATSGRCSWPWTAAPTRCSRRATSPT